MDCQQHSLIYKHVAISATILGLIAPWFLGVAHANQSEDVDKARTAVNASVESLVSAKDEVTQNDEDKEAKKFAAAKETVKNVVTLGIAEIGSLEKKLNGLEIEKLVTDDYTFDAAKLHDAFATGLAEGKAYHKTTLKRLEKTETRNEVQQIAAELQAWRDNAYIPLAHKLFSIELVLRQKTIVTMGNNRFEKILNDLQKLKRAKLIALEPFDEVLRRATASQKIADALHKEATGLLLATLRNEQAAIDNQRIVNLVEQSFVQVKQMYKQFMEINRLLKGMLATSDAAK